MKTVQEYFRAANKKELAKDYLDTYPIKLNEIKDKNLTVKEIIFNAEKKLVKYIERLQSLKIEKSEDGKTGILFVHKICGTEIDENSYSLIHLEELQKDGTDVQTYAYEFTSQNVIMGFLVSDTKYTQKNIHGLLVDVMFEASFFGFEQEDLEQEKTKLDESIKDVELGNVHPIEDLYDYFGIEKEPQDRTAEKLKLKLYNTQFKLNEYYRKKELEELIELITKERNVGKKENCLEK